MRNAQSRNDRSLVKIAGLAVLIGAIVLICLTTTAYADDPAGAVTFKAKCAMCHGADGTGKTPMGAKLNIPNLVSPEVQKKPDAALVESIAKGKNKMPEFGSKLSADQITQVKDYIREIAKKH